MDVIVTLRFYHGGYFRKNKLVSLEYLMGELGTSQLALMNCAGGIWLNW